MSLPDVRDPELGDIDESDLNAMLGAAGVATKRHGHRFWRPAVQRVLYVGLALALVYAGVKVAGGFTDALHQLDGVNPWWFVPALVAVTLRFVVLGAQLRLLRGTSELPDTRLGIRIALVAFGLGGVMPASPAEGFALSTVAMRKRGVTTRQSWLMLASSQWMTFWALIIVFAVDRVVATAAGELHHRHPWKAVITSSVLLALSAGIAWLLTRPRTIRVITSATRWLPGRSNQTPAERSEAAATLYADIQATLGSRTNRVKVTGLSCLSRLADGAILWCTLMAVHAHIPFGVAVVAYVVAMVVAWVPLLPSGLGLAEIAVPALLHRFNVPLATGLSAVLLWRAFSLVLPGVVGVGSWVTLRKAPEDGSTRQAARTTLESTNQAPSTTAAC